MQLYLGREIYYCAVGAIAQRNSNDDDDDVDDDDAAILYTIYMGTVKTVDEQKKDITQGCQFCSH